MAESITSARSKDDLERFYRPRSIVVVGAHDEREPLRNLTGRLNAKAADVGAEIHYVNPRRPEVFGRPTFASIADVPGEIDVLAILVGDPVQILEDAAQKRPRFTFVFAGGFSEVGTAEGAARNVALLAAVQAAGTRLNGPNTTVNSLEVLDKHEGPAIALVTQSGMQGRPMVQMQEFGVPISYWATTGNEADLESAEFIEFFARDEGTKAIAAYIEGFADGDQLRSAAVAALEEQTPITLIKIGRSDTGAHMAQSHTGHLAGADSAYGALFEQFGITRVDDIDALIEVSLIYSRTSLPGPGGIGLFCTSGGSAAHLSDLIASRGLPIPTLTEHTQSELLKYIPSNYLVSNPVDNGGPVMMEGHGPNMIEAILDDPGIAVVLVPITGDFEPLTIPCVETIIHGRAYSDKPIIAVWQGPTLSKYYHRLLDAGVPVARNLRNAITAVEGLLRRRDLAPGLADFAHAVRALPDLSGWAAGETVTLNEAESVSWLGERGIPFVESKTASSLEGARAAAQKIGYPVVLKGLVADVHHKSDLGLVKVGLASEQELNAAAQAMINAVAPRTIDNYLVSALAPRGVEFLLGLTHDPVVGPVVVLGAGGTDAELHQDVALSVLPLTRQRAEEMVDSLRISKKLDGWRGAPALDREALLAVLLDFARVAAANPHSLVEVDVNPLLVTENGAIGLDALVRLAVSDGSGVPGHD